MSSYPPPPGNQPPQIPPPPQGWTPGSAPPGYNYGTQVQTNPFDSKSTTILVLGILGIVVCGLIAPFAWVMGNNLRKEAAAAGYPEPGNCKAGRICGIIGSVLVGLVVAFVILMLVVGLASSGSSS